MKKHAPLMFMALGGLLFAAGVLYGVFAGGIPGPDDSPAEAARVSTSGSISLGAVSAGVLCFLVGLVAGVMRLLSRRQQRRG